MMQMILRTHCKRKISPWRIASFLCVMLVSHVPTIAAEAQIDPAAKAAGMAASQLDITPMTTTEGGGRGFFQDPYPVRLSGGRADRELVFSGTTKAVMTCRYPLRPRCFDLTPVQIKLGVMASDIAEAGTKFTNFQNLDLFQADDGSWHAVLAIGVRTPNAPPGQHWTVLVHASPPAGSTPDMVPTVWTADTVLSGSFKNDVQGNYDGKYYEENGRLYLLYVRNLVPGPKLRNGIVLQLMRSPTEPERQPPTLLLAPGDRYGPLASEWYAGTEAKLVEAPFIALIGGKHALIYSTGAYQHVDYKVGVAWSDTLIPPPGVHYRKVLRPDPGRVWKEDKGRPEVYYLLQSQKPRWPNFTPDAAWGPGVASVERSPAGTWSLFFAGYDAANRPTPQDPVANAQDRRPFSVELRATVPADASVATVTDAELAEWLEPVAH